MGTEDSNDFPSSCTIVRESKINVFQDTGCTTKVETKGETSETTGFASSEGNELIQKSDSDMDVESDPSGLQVSVELTETAEVNSATCTDNGPLTVQVESQISRQEINDVKALSGVKRPRATLDEEQPSVHVTYNLLSRESRRMLEGLLQQWSQWHSKHCSSTLDSKEVLESGEETYFPALHVGLDKPSAVAFWMDKQVRNQKCEDFVPLDGNSVPLYDRGYSFALTATDSSSNVEGGMEMVDTSRCFNCGSYSHAMKDCSKPRNIAAVNSARKQHKARRNQSASSRNSTRYYQDSPKGKYDGIRPGVLEPETRKLLGLGEFDPPPWLNRMREIGYPPGYMEPEDDDLPSGITIFADEEKKEESEEGEEGEIPEKSYADPPTKMSVDFPGVNAPIPEHADERSWAAGSSRNRSHSRHNHTSDPTNRGHYHERRWSRDVEDDAPPGSDFGTSPSLAGYSQRYGSYSSRYSSLSSSQYNYTSDPINRGHYHEHRRSRDVEDDGPPGCDPGTSPSLSGYPHRYGGYDAHYSSPSPRDSASLSRIPSFGRSPSDNGRRSPYR